MQNDTTIFVANKLSDETRQAMIQDCEEKVVELRKQWDAAHIDFLKRKQEDKWLREEFGRQVDVILRDPGMGPDTFEWLWEYLKRDLEKSRSGIDGNTESHGIFLQSDPRRSLIFKGVDLNLRLTSLFRTRHEVVQEFLNRSAQALIRHDKLGVAQSKYDNRYIDRWNVPIGWVPEFESHYVFMDPEAKPKPTAYSLPVDLVPHLCELKFSEQIANKIVKWEPHE